MFWAPRLVGCSISLKNFRSFEAWRLSYEVWRTGAILRLMQLKLPHFPTPIVNSRVSRCPGVTHGFASTWRPHIQPGPTEHVTPCSRLAKLSTFFNPIILLDDIAFLSIQDISYSLSIWSNYHVSIFIKTFGEAIPEHCFSNTTEMQRLYRSV